MVLPCMLCVRPKKRARAGEMEIAAMRVGKPDDMNLDT